MRAFLLGANFREADFSEADLTEAIVGWVVFGDVDMSVVKGLETVKHVGP